MPSSLTRNRKPRDSTHPTAAATASRPIAGRRPSTPRSFGGARIGSSAEIRISPEIDQGFGLDDTLGVAGFPSGEAYKIGKDRPYVRLARLFVREAVDLSERREALEPAQMQLGGATGPDRLVFTVGKFGVPDIFDNNAYAHDARNDFLNWASIDAGTFDDEPPIPGAIRSARRSSGTTDRGRCVSAYSTCRTSLTARISSPRSTSSSWLRRRKGTSRSGRATARSE